MELINRTLSVSSSDSIDEEKRSVRVIASSTAIDSYGEIVEQSFRLERYQRNPVVLYGHNKSGILGMGGDPEDTLPIGYATELGISGGKLLATLNFVDEKANPLAPMVFEGFRQGSIRAVSIGFFPHEVREETRNGEDVYVLSQNELFEISVVPMGANPDAVRLSVGEAHDQVRKRLAKMSHPGQRKLAQGGSLICARFQKENPHAVRPQAPPARKGALAAKRSVIIDNAMRRIFGGGNDAA
jgi:phage head maturation protease